MSISHNKNLYQEITLDAATSYANQYCEIKLTTSNFRYAIETGDNVRFFSMTNELLLFFKECYIPNGTSRFLVRIPTIGTTKIKMSYGTARYADPNSKFAEVCYRKHWEDSNCIAAWHLDEHNDQSYDFNGSTDDLSLAAYNPGYIYGTICMLVKFDTHADDQYLFDYYVDANNWVRLYYNNTDERITYEIKYEGLIKTDMNSDSDIASDGQWHCIVITYAGLASTPAMYIDNVLQSSGSSYAWFLNIGASATTFIGGENSNSKSLDGKIAYFKLWNSKLTSNEIEENGRGDNVDTSNMKIYLNMKNVSGTTMYDLSGNNNNFTITGAVASVGCSIDCPTCGGGQYHLTSKEVGEPKTHGSSGIKFGNNKALLLNGNDNLITLGNRDWATSVEGAFSIWVKFNSHADDQTLFEYYHDANHYLILYHNNALNCITYYFHSDIGDRTLNSTTDVAAIPGWHHICIVSGWFLYIDGVLEASTAGIRWFSLIASQGESAAVRIGNDHNETNAIDGKISMIKIWYDYRLSSTEVNNDMKLTIPAINSLLLYYNCKDISGTTLPDQTSNGINGTISGAIETLGDYPFTGKYAIELDKTGNRVTTQTTVDYTSMTISATFNTFLLDANPHTLISLNNNLTGNSNGCIWINSATQMRVWLSAGASEIDITAMANLSLNTYHNVTATINATDTRVYFDGILIGIDTSSIAPPDHVAYTVGSGSYNSDNQTFIGRIGEVKIWNVKLNGLEVQQHINGENVQSGAIQLWWDMQTISGTTITDRAGIHDGTLVGSSHQVCDDINIFDGSLYEDEVINDAKDFDGTDDYLTGTTPTPATGSISLWFKADTIAGLGVVDTLFSLSSDSVHIGLNNSQLRFYTYDGVDTVISYFTTPQVNTWYFVVGTWNGTTQYLYVNGILQDSDNQSAPSYPNTTSWIGATVGPTNCADAKVSEVKLWSSALTQAEVNDLYFKSPFTITSTIRSMSKLMQVG